MTVNYIATNTIGAGNQFAFAAAGDALVVLPGATLGSTNSTAFSTAFNDIEVTVLGNMVSVAQLSLTTLSSFTLGAAGTFTSYQASISLAGLFLNGTGSVAQIDGTFTAPEAVGLLTGGGGQIISVNGSISAASAIYLGIGGTGGDIVVNSGRITSNAQGDAANGTLFNNAIFVEGVNGIITNLASGIITATSSEGNGVRLSSTASGAQITNSGTIQSLHSAAIFAEVAGQAKLINTGLIQGTGFSFRGDNSGTYSILNSGRMIGDVLFGTGNDIFDGRNGQIDGAWTGGSGNDLYDGRGASLISGLVSGGNGFDTLLGGEGAETINGDANQDTIRGYGGDDVLSGGLDTDSIGGGDGDDTLSGGDAYDDLSGGAGNDVIQGDDGMLTASGGDGADLISVSVSALSAFFVLGLGGAGDDTFQGGVGADTIRGGSGDDDVFSSDGDDLVLGNGGDDSLNGQDGLDVVYGGSGDDTISNGLGNAQLFGGRGYDTILGNEGNDLLDAGSDDDTVSGGLGLDTLLGGAGADQLLAGDDSDSVDGGTGDDTILAGAGSDRVTGGNGEDFLLGEGGSDTINGGTGDDAIQGGLARDILTGGIGQDVFILAITSESGTTAATRDAIVDFQTGVDRLDLSLVDADTKNAGNQAFTFIGSGAFTGALGELRYSTADGLVQGDVNGDGIADFVIELQNFVALGSADLIL